MKEIGIDISGHRPKGLKDTIGSDIALVIGLCEEEACPVVPGAQSEHWPLRDPRGSTDLNVYRELREDLRRRIDALVRRLL